MEILEVAFVLECASRDRENQTLDKPIVQGCRGLSVVGHMNPFFMGM